MSRPDDAMGTNAGHPTGWPRQQDMVTRDPVTGRPLVMAQTPEAWQNAQAAPAAGQGYHYPGQAAGQPGQEFHAPAAVPQQHYQPAAPAAPRTQPGGRAQPAQPPEYAPQFARYSGAPEGQPQQYAADAYQRPQAQAAPAPAWPAQAGGQYGAQNPAGYAHNGGQQPGMDPNWPGERLPYQNLTTGEPRSYDQTAYAPPAQNYGQPQGGAGGAGVDQGQFGQYAQPQGYADPHGSYQQPAYQEAGYQQGQYAPTEQGYDPRTGQPYPPADGYGQGYQQNGGMLDAGQPIGGSEGGYDQDYAVPPPRKRRGLLVAGALVCAVAVGGGLAFVYKTFGQSGKRIGPPPVIAKATPPAKVAVADAQGRQFDNADKKVLGRLSEPGGSVSSASVAGGSAPIVPGMVVSMPPSQSAPAASGGADASGSPSTRPVQTVQLDRNGNPVGQQPAPKSLPNLPGVQLDTTMNAPVMRGPTSDMPPPQQAQPVPAAKVQGQRVAAATPPAQAAEEEAPAAQAQPKAKTARAPIPRAPKESAAAAAAATPPAPGGGYVAVLSSQKDRGAALRIFADLAQKFPDQLGSRQPEVQEANLGEKGVWQRLVVGPPSSQQSAKELCSQLKAAGYAADCWAKQY